MGNTWTYQLEFALRILGTGSGVVLAAVVAFLFLFSFTRAGRWMVLSGLLYSATFSFNTHGIAVLVSPLEQIRHLSEVLTLIFIGFLILPSLTVRNLRLHTPLLAASVAFWVLEVVYAVRVQGSVDAGKAVASVLIFTSLLVVFGYGVPHWLRELDDLHAVFRAMGVAGLLFVGSTVLQLVVNRSAVVAGGRLFAITGNPQYAALVLAISLVPVCFLASSRREPLGLRLVWVANAGLMVMMLIWTGSRTGVLTALVGLGLLFRRRIGRLLGTGIVVAVFVFAALSIFEVSSESSSRILSMADTRSGTWRMQFDNFLANPMIGTVTDTNFGTVENSYLTVAGRTGIIGLSILAVALWLIGTAIRRLRRLRAAVRTLDEAMLVDLVVAGIVGILAGSVLEGILVGTLTFMLLALYVYLGLLKFLSDRQTLEDVESAARSREHGVNCDRTGNNGSELMEDPFQQLYLGQGGDFATTRPRE